MERYEERTATVKRCAERTVVVVFLSCCSATAVVAMAKRMVVRIKIIVLLFSYLRSMEKRDERSLF